MGCGVPAGVWIITIPILTYGICAVNRNDVPVWESSVPILCQWCGWEEMGFSQNKEAFEKSGKSLFIK